MIVNHCCPILLWLVVAGCTCAAWGQPDEPGPTVTIDYPDRLPLTALTDYVSQTLDIHIAYGDELKGQDIVLRPGRMELPRERLLDLLRSALAMRDLALIEDDLPSFYRIAPAKDVRRMVDNIQTAPGAAPARPGRIVTQVIEIPSGDTKAVVEKIKAFTSSEKASVVEVPERGLVIVTDYEPVIARILRLIEWVDVQPEPIVTELVHAQHQDAGRLCAQVEAILDAESQDAGGAALRTSLQPGLAAGSIVISGPNARVERAKTLLDRFDVDSAPSLPTEIYAPRHASVARLRTLIERLVLGAGEGRTSGVEVYADESFNRLYVTAAPAVHARIAALLLQEDVPLPVAMRRTRIYRPKNRTAAEIIDTLSELLGSSVAQEPSRSASAAIAGTTRQPPGPNRPPVSPGRGQVLPQPPAVESPQPGTISSAGPRQVQGPDYLLSEDEATNAIIVVGTPEFHTQFTELLAELDRRPAQVLIEMTLVGITLSNSLNLGVELEGLDLGESWDYLLFSSFGLSEVNVATGQRVLTPGVGVNGVLLRPDSVPAIIRALATQGDSKVISSPRMLVSDNTSATLRNVEEAPFTSVNASDTVATTSFAGFESAGTTLTVTPHIAEGEHLSLEYNLTFSNFTGASTEATIPPPRTTNAFTGEVQVPDGYTIVVGGLEVENESDTVSEVPLLGRIPILGLLFQSSSTARTRTRIFAFIRPVILRDDQFADLKYFSAQALDDAELDNPDFPQDELMWMN